MMNAISAQSNTSYIAKVAPIEGRVVFIFKLGPVHSSPLHKVDVASLDLPGIMSELWKTECQCERRASGKLSAELPPGTP